MEFEERNERNERPKEPSKNLPMAVLLVLVGIICALLYIGWKYMSDDSASSEELTPAPADSVSKVKTPKIEEDNTATATKPAETSTKTDAGGLPPISVAKVGDKKTATDTKPTTTTATAEKKVAETKPAPAKAEIPAGGETYTHTVDAGETFLGIANRYNVKAETLKKMNPNVDPNGVKVGVTKLNVRIKAIHTVGPGDVLRVVSGKYHVPVALIMAANKKTRNYAERGEQLIIPYPTKQ